jgi:hypothetical protein
MTDRYPFQLSHPAPVTCNGGKERLEKLLIEGCYCGSRSARLTRRKQSNGVWVVALQCEGCGSAKMSGLRKADFIELESFPEFDTALANRNHEEWLKRIDEEREKADAERAEFQKKYAEFLKSPEWYNLRNFKLQRDGLICEACGDSKSPYNLRVHHLTYRYGFMPPLWCLKTVCVECHDRLHANKHGYEDNWCQIGLSEGVL